MDYLTDFVSNCIKNGKSSITDISSSAKNRIQEIEFEYKKIESLKKEEKALKTLLKQLGGDVQPATISHVESSSSFNSLDCKLQNMCASILDFVSDNPGASVRSIIDAVSDLENTKTVLSSLKWLIDNKILSRSEGDRKIFYGESWLEKENLLSITNLKN